MIPFRYRLRTLCVESYAICCIWYVSVKSYNDLANPCLLLVLSTQLKELNNGTRQVEAFFVCVLLFCFVFLACAVDFQFHEFVCGGRVGFIPAKQEKKRSVILYCFCIWSYHPIIKMYESWNLFASCCFVFFFLAVCFVFFQVNRKWGGGGVHSRFSSKSKQNVHFINYKKRLLSAVALLYLPKRNSRNWTNWLCHLYWDAHCDKFQQLFWTNCCSICTEMCTVTALN